MSEEQLGFVENGNISPCPYREECSTYKVGCGGFSYWCKRFETNNNDTKGDTK